MAGTFDDKLKSFLSNNNLKHVIGFSGSTMENESSLRSLIDQSMDVYKNFPVAMCTGGTRWNLPMIATESAKSRGLKVIGIMPERGVKYKASGLDLEIGVPSRYRGSEWGDESALFAKVCDGIQLFGGGPGTGVEIFHALKINVGRLDHQQYPIYIAPVKGFGGIVELLYRSSFVDTAFMPEKPFEDGAQAAKYLLRKFGYQCD